jgi:hypothetical protein
MCSCMDGYGVRLLADCACAALSIQSGQPVRYTIFSIRSGTHGYDADEMLDFGTATVPGPEAEEDDWFGEGNAFESGEELASALLAMAEHPDEVPASAPEAASEARAEYRIDETFVLTDRSSPAQTAPIRTPASEDGSAAAPRGWSVRSPGAIPLPPRAPGRSGWSIRNSVKVLQHTEDVLNALREEAIVAALLAASRALHPERSLPKPKPQTR